VQYVSDFAQTYRALRWLMGDLDVASYEPILYALPLIGVAFAGFAWLARPLNLMSAGMDAAATRGVEVERVQRGAFFAASLATGAAVSVGGPIGFVGIIVPHLVRLLVGADHRLVLPASTFFGAAFLVGCDALARTVIAPIELPVGIITAVIGGTVFLMVAHNPPLAGPRVRGSVGPKVHRNPRWTVVFMASLLIVGVVWPLEPSNPRTPGPSDRRESFHSCPPSLRCCSPLARARRSLACRATTRTRLK
jgi:hypothetical protein